LEKKEENFLSLVQSWFGVKHCIGNLISFFLKNKEIIDNLIYDLRKLRKLNIGDKIPI